MVTRPSPRASVSLACAGRADDIHRYLDGEMLPRDREAMTKHLQACAGCDAYFAEMRRFRDATRDLLTREGGGGAAPAARSPSVRRLMMTRIEGQLRSQVADRLCDLAKLDLARLGGVAVHLAGLCLTAGAIQRRLREVIEQRNALGDLRRSVHGPWNELREHTDKNDGGKRGCGDSRNDDGPLALIDRGRERLDKALQFAPRHGRTNLMQATFARAGGDVGLAWNAAIAASECPDTKLRAMAHLALAHLCLGADETDEAERQLRRARVYDEGSPWPHYGLALVYFARGLTRDARRHLADLGEAVERSRRPDSVRDSLQRFMCEDLEWLAERHHLNKLRRVHFSRLVAQAAGENEVRPGLSPSFDGLPPDARRQVAAGGLLEPAPGAGPWEIP